MTVDLYTMPSCPQCTMTKKQLEKLGITYTESDIECIRDEAIERGIASAPVVAIDGEPAWGGFRPDRIKALVA